ncbi:S1 family peptidase [Undibacterium sp. Ji49W]|uniref:S1 family peptidase n=1 Tax=Undibacterium sp. Ji49W TaxID=3413040 RepID=UPI003BF1EC1F
MDAKNKSVDHAIVRSTVQLLAGKHGQAPTSTGTGFFYQVTDQNTNRSKVSIITNKHVVKDADVVQFVLSTALSIDNLNDANQPEGRADNLLSVQIQGNIYPHPDPNIDLCGIDITNQANTVFQSGHKIRGFFIDSTWLPDENDRANLRDIEQVLVIGYPKGLADNYNNMPISRIGSTATHPCAKYQGKSDFLIDVAAFNGSSGSPVFSYETPMFRLTDGSYTPGTKVNLIGVVWGVIETSTEGRLVPVTIPSSTGHVPLTQTSLNLALAVHAECILVIDSQMRQSLN